MSARIAAAEWGDRMTSILFDLDDTILDRNKGLGNFIELFKEKYSSAMDISSNLIINDLIFDVDFKGYRPRNEMFGDLQSRIMWKHKPEVDELVSFWNREFPNCAEPAYNLYKVLDYFTEKKIKMGMVTNGQSQFQNAKIDKLKIRKYMQTIIISGDVGARKPDKEIFEIALSEMGSDNRSTLFIGDNPEADIKGAFNAGLIPVWVSGGKTWSEAEYAPCYTIINISELIGLGLTFSKLGGKDVI